jgi:hypothetical protein
VDLFARSHTSHINWWSLYLRPKLHNKSANLFWWRKHSCTIDYVYRYTRLPQTAEDGLLAQDSYLSFVPTPASYSTCASKDASTDRRPVQREHSALMLPREVRLTPHWLSCDNWKVLANECGYKLILTPRSFGRGLLSIALWVLLLASLSGLPKDVSFHLVLEEVKELLWVQLIYTSLILFILCIILKSTYQPKNSLKIQS